MKQYKIEIEYDENMIRAYTPKEALVLGQKLLMRDFDENERISEMDALKNSFFKKLTLIISELLKRHLYMFIQASVNRMKKRHLDKCF